MKQYFPSNPRHNKAAMILASMSPDMVRDIVNLVNFRGTALVADVSSDEGTTRPYAIFSRDYVPDEDFPQVFMGMTTIFTASMKKLTEDFDFYEQVLKDAFYLPSSMASAIAKNIETRDIIGGSKEAVDSMGWFSKAGARLMELTREAVNYAPSVLQLPWENDQTQKYDIDFLYEVKLLGQAVDQLNSRANLMKGQAKAAGQLGIFNPNSKIYGDVEDNFVGDPVDAYELQFLSALKPEMGFPIPLAIFGGLKKLFQGGKDGNRSKIGQLMEKAGLIKSKAPVDPHAQEAAQRILSNNPSPVGAIMSAGDAKSAIAQVIDTLQRVNSSTALGDVLHQVADDYGDAAAEAWQNGNVPALMHNVIQQAGDTLATTGDPDLDEAIIGDVIGDIDAEMGDAEGAFDAEMGGLFKRARINRKIRQGNRRSRRNAKREAKQNRKNKEQAELLAAQDYAQDAGTMKEERVISVDDYLAQMRAAQGNQEASPSVNELEVQGSSYTNAPTVQDDYYNPNAGGDFMMTDQLMPGAYGMNP